MAFIQPFFEWCDGLAMSQAYRESLYLFALTQCLHLVAVTTFVGAIAIVDLRLLGWGPVGQSRAELARSAQRILLWAGLALALHGLDPGDQPAVAAQLARRVQPLGLGLHPQAEQVLFGFLERESPNPNARA